MPNLLFVNIQFEVIVTSQPVIVAIYVDDITKYLAKNKVSGER